MKLISGIRGEKKSTSRAPYYEHVGPLIPQNYVEASLKGRGDRKVSFDLDYYPITGGLELLSFQKGNGSFPHQNAIGKYYLFS
jgi:hypothetical protein